MVDWNIKGSKKTPTNPGFPDRADILAFVIPARSYALGATKSPGREFTGMVDLGKDKDDPTKVYVVPPLQNGSYEHAAAFLLYNMERYYIWWNFMDKTIGQKRINRLENGTWQLLK